MQDNEKPAKIRHELIALIVILIVALFLAALVVPSLPINKPTSCFQAEAEASEIASAINVYVSEHKNFDIRRSDIEGLVDIENPWTFTINDDVIIVQVTVRGGKCPDKYQNENPGWDSSTYTYKFLK